MSLPMVRAKENLWLSVATAWQKAGHFSTLASIFTDKGHIAGVQASCQLLPILGYLKNLVQTGLPPTASDPNWLMTPGQ